MTVSKIFFYFCFSFIGGIFISSFFSISQLLMLSFLIFGLILISVFWQYPAGKPSASNGAGKKFVVIGFSILFLVLGIWRHQLAELGIRNGELRKFNDLEQKITLVGVVSKEPDIREKSQKLTIKVENLNQSQDIKPIENGSRYIEERVLVTSNRYPEYQYGDKLKITGFLKTPFEFENFNYKNYLAREGIYSVIYWPEIELQSRENYRGPTSIIYSHTIRRTNFVYFGAFGALSSFGMGVYAKILNFKNKLRESIYQNLSPPQSSILGAMILGDKRKISEEWKEKLNIAGVRHITAISGMHVMILSGILMYLGIALGLWRGQAFYFALVLLILFIIMVGMPASAVRAGIMGGLFLLAQKVGRLKNASRAIVFACTGMLALNPLLLKLDVGFQLSFLAVMGIIYLMPSFQNWFLPLKALSSLLAMTLAAQVFTLPILIYNFGYISSVAPITNILIVPLLPYIMVLGFISGLTGMIWQSLGWILSWPAWLLLTYLTKIVDFFSSFSWASQTLRISWIWLIVFYSILGLITWRLQESQKLKFLEY